MINNLKKSDTWNFQLTIGNIFTSFIDNDEEDVMHSTMHRKRSFPLRISAVNKNKSAVTCVFGHIN